VSDIKRLAEILLDELPAIHPDRRAQLEQLAGRDQAADDTPTAAPKTAPKTGSK
jgi:hypothetical protein